MRKLFLVLAFAFPALITKAQTTYDGVNVNVGVVLSNGRTSKVHYATAERPDGFHIIVNESLNLIQIQSGNEKERWITVKIEKKEVDQNGDVYYEGCANFDGLKKPLERDQCLCGLIILNDQIALNWGTMMYNYYRGSSTKWGIKK